MERPNLDTCIGKGQSGGDSSMAQWGLVWTRVGQVNRGRDMRSGGWGVTWTRVRQVARAKGMGMASLEGCL